MRVGSYEVQPGDVLVFVDREINEDDSRIELYEVLRAGERVEDMPDLAFFQGRGNAVYTAPFEALVEVTSETKP